MNIILLKEAEIRECVRLSEEVIAVVEDAFTKLADGNAVVPPIVSIEIPQRRGELDIKTAYMRGLDSFAIKIASGFLGNEELGLPIACGMMVVVSSRTGFPEAVLFDNGYLTQVRTGAAGAIAAKYLAPSKVETVGVIGAGSQGRYQIMGLKLVREFQRVLVFDLDPKKADHYAVEMEPILGVNIVNAGDVNTVVRESEVVVTTTPSKSPYLRADSLHRGLHITAMGSDMENKQELHTEVFRRVDRICCDLRSQCFVRGELHHALKEGIISMEDEIVELGELTSGRVTGRQYDNEITICDLTGVGVQDTAIALLTYRNAKSCGLGLPFEV